jgi:hypothetical protein
MTLSIIRLLSTLVVAAAGCVAELRWMTPSAGQWAQIDRLYSQAAARHEFYCNYANESILSLIRGTHFDTWLHRPHMFHTVGPAIAAALLVYSSAAWLQSHERRTNSD